MKKQWMAGLAALCVLLLGGCGEKTARTQEVPALLTPVNVKSDSEEVHRGDVSQIDVYDAQVVPYIEELSFPIEGQVLEVKVTLGQWVQAGDVLMTLDQRAQQEQAEELKESIEYALRVSEYENRILELNVQSAQTEWERLTARGGEKTETALARLAVEEAEAALRQQKEIQEQSLKQSRLQLAALEETLGQDELIAPVDGYVLFQQNLQTGSWVKDFETVMCIADHTRLSVQSEYIATSAYNKPGTLLYVLIDGKEFPVSQKKVDTEDYLRHVLLGEELKSEFAFEEGADLTGIEAGMFAAVCYEFNRSADTLWIPANALLSDEESRYVYVLDENGAQERRNVEVGMENNRQAEILSGLEEGERVHVRN